MGYKVLRKVITLLLAILITISTCFSRVTNEQLIDISSKLNYIYGTTIIVQVYPTQLGAMATGQRIVYIDPTMVENESYEAIFGVLAHEWAHEVLNHVPQIFLHQWMSGQNISTNIFSQQKELEADYYAGRALKMYNLPLEPFIDLLKRYNVYADYTHPYFRTHPSTEERIRAILNGYNSI